MTYPREYDREKNVNTPQYWDIAHRRMKDVTSHSVKVARRVAEILSALPYSPVVEYGFGSMNLAYLIGDEVWAGVDFSERAVLRATEDGFSAMIGRCEDALLFDRETVVGIEVLEHLDEDEMYQFLEACRPAHHAIFSVPKPTERDTRFPAHMRTFGEPEDFEEFLFRYWPNVEVERVGGCWLLGHGWRARA